MEAIDNRGWCHMQVLAQRQASDGCVLIDVPAKEGSSHGLHNDCRSANASESQTDDATLAAASWSLPSATAESEAGLQRSLCRVPVESDISESDIAEDGQAGVLCCWALLNLSSFEPAQVSNCTCSPSACQGCSPPPAIA